MFIDELKIMSKFSFINVTSKLREWSCYQLLSLEVNKVAAIFMQVSVMSHRCSSC